WQERLADAGVPTTEVLDRQYFKSIYFNDPDGHILEIATAGPGFATDEDPAHLGESLRLPAWLEADRPAIAGRLRPLTVG
nr:VOC family protein [Chloroflexia bacterium]